MSNFIIPSARSSAPDCSPSSLTPETDEMASMRRTVTEWRNLCEKLERERNKTQKELDHARAEIHQLKGDLVMLAKLASDKPQFLNPVHAMYAKNLCHQILSENADVLAPAGENTPTKLQDV